MTMPAMAQPLGDRLPSAIEQAAANHLRTILAARTSEQDQVLTIVEGSGRNADIALTPGLTNILMELLRHLGRGDAVTIVPVSQMLTTQQSADILNVSRPYFVSLLEKKTIPFVLTGRHRRIKAEDLFRYKRDRDAARSQALGELAELDAEFL